MTFSEYMNERSRIFILTVGVLLMLLIGSIDYITGSEISFSIFFLIPVFLVTWFVNGKSGGFIAVASAVTWYIVDTQDGCIYSSPLIPVWNAMVRLGFFAITAAILLRLKKALANEQILSRTDAQTGVANARSFYQLANAEIERARRYEHQFLAAYIDIDNFKLINDGFGHNTGDKVLRFVAETMVKNLRSTDVVARIGGDEFVILMPEAGKEYGLSIVEKIQKILLQEMINNQWPVTFSIGATMFVNPPKSVDELIKETDSLMYQAKKNGKNQIAYSEFNGPR